MVWAVPKDSANIRGKFFVVVVVVVVIFMALNRAVCIFPRTLARRTVMYSSTKWMLTRTA